MLLCETSGIGSYAVLIVIVVLMVLMMGFSMFSNKKKRKKVEETMNKLAKGDKIKTIGGFVGTIVAFNDGDNTMVINLGTEDNQILATVDKAAFYTTITSANANTTVVQTNDGKKVEVEDDGVKALDDVEDDAKAQEKADKKAARKKARKDSKEAVDVVAIEEPKDDIFEEDSVSIDRDVNNTGGDGEVKN